MSRKSLAQHPLYDGLFEVELVDNPPGAEGDAALARGIARLGETLTRLTRVSGGLVSL